MKNTRKLQYVGYILGNNKHQVLQLILQGRVDGRRGQGRTTSRNGLNKLLQSFLGRLLTNKSHHIDSQRPEHKDNAKNNMVKTEFRLIKHTLFGMSALS